MAPEDTRLRLVCASANPDKAGEIATLLGDAVELVARPAEVPEVVEDADTLEGNARLKAVALAAATGLPAIADDTGLEVDALDGAPGVYSARFAGPAATYADNVAKLLAELTAVPEAGRTARFRCVVMVRWPDGREVSAEGVVEGRIAEAERGSGGFGYDPLFVPAEGGGRTFAEMEPAAKHELSHRGRALRALLGRLGEGLSR
jgi:XTP/dITP diphosphohydrolase